MFEKKLANSAGLHPTPGLEQFEEINIPRGQRGELACPARFWQADSACDRTHMSAISVSEPRMYLLVFLGHELEMAGARVQGRRDFDGAVEWLAA